MTKKTLLIILVLVLATIGLVWLSIYTVPLQGPQSLTKQPTIPPFAKTTLSFSSSTATGISNQYLMYVIVSTSTNKITGVQLELSYDPKALINVDILPGDFISDPVVLFKKIDEKVGRISYTLAIKMGQAAASGSGNIAKIQFSPIAGSKAATTAMRFLPKTKVSAEGELQSVLKSASATVINLQTLSSTTTSKLPLPTVNK
jgi:hypothetical protein